MSISLFNHHVTRGWKRATTKEYILKANCNLHIIKPITNHTATDSQSQLPFNKEQLFIHMEFHPNDMRKKSVHAVYNHSPWLTSLALVCPSQLNKELSPTGI